MRRYKIWTHFILTVTVAIISAGILGVLAYWVYQVYQGNLAFQGARGGRLLLDFGVVTLVQVVLYGLALGLAITIPRVHRSSRILFRWWIGSSLTLLLLFLIIFGGNDFWTILLVYYPFLSIITGSCALVTLYKSAKRLGRHARRLSDVEK